METWRILVDEKARDLGLELPSAHRDQLFNYLNLLNKWRSSINLVGSLTSEDLVRLHLVDSLAPVARIPAAARRLVDVGSGAGFPAVAIAILNPALSVTALEPNRKKHAFLSTVRRELDLANFHPRAEKFEEHRTRPDFEPYDVAISRATFALEQWLVHAVQLVGESGLILAMEGARTAELPAAATRHPYVLEHPSGQRSRAVITVQAADVPRGTSSASTG